MQPCCLLAFLKGDERFGYEVNGIVLSDSVEGKEDQHMNLIMGGNKETAETDLKLGQ